jgi:hypothetical protein
MPAPVNKKQLKEKKEGSDSDKRRDEGFEAIGSLFGQFEVKDDQGYITREFQDYGYRLAVELDDLDHKSLYIKLAKEENRGLLEQARSFVIDSHADNKGALFMWKLKQLRKKQQDETSESADDSDAVDNLN